MLAPLPTEVSPTLPSAELFCVPEADVYKFWPLVSFHVRQAMKRGGISSFDAVEHAVLAGRNLLWLAADDDRIQAVAITEINKTEWRKLCLIVACGGADMDNWLPLISGIEKYARTQGCAAMQIMGRKGWMRKLKDYRTTKIVLEKELM